MLTPKMVISGPVWGFVWLEIKVWRGLGLRNYARVLSCDASPTFVAFHNSERPRGVASLVPLAPFWAVLGLGTQGMVKCGGQLTTNNNFGVLVLVRIPERPNVSKTEQFSTLSERSKGLIWCQLA